MASAQKTLEKVLRGTSDANIGFRDLCQLKERLGFEYRIEAATTGFANKGSLSESISNRTVNWPSHTR